METKKSQNNNMEFGMCIARRSILKEIDNGCKKNLVLSPLSIHIALNMLASGSTGQTLEQLLRFLESDSITHLNAQSSLLMELATGDICSNLFPQNSSSSGLNPFNQNQFPQNPSGFVPMPYNSTSSTTNQEFDSVEIDDLPPTRDNSIHQNPSNESGPYFMNHQNQFYQNSSSDGQPFPFYIHPNQFSTNQVTNKPTKSLLGNFLPNNPNQLYENSSSESRPFLTNHQNQFYENSSNGRPFSFHPNQFSQKPTNSLFGPSLFGFPTPSSSVSHSNSYQNPSSESGPIISLVNGIWVDKRFPMKHSFKQLAEDVYKANAQSVDFLNQGEQVRNKINAWAREASKGHIDPLLNDTISKDVILVLANAFYFKGTWINPFNASKTEDEDFHLLNGETVRVPFMKKTHTYCIYGSFDGFKLLKMRYKIGKLDNKRYAMSIFLPDKKDGLQELVERFNSDPRLFLKNHSDLQHVKLNKLWVPKLKYEYELKALKIMKELGLDLPFDDKRCEMTEMVENNSERVVYVSEVIQKAYIVNKEGTIATAVTAGMTFSGASGGPYVEPPKINFIADHPFLFMIKEEVSDIVLFVGVALNPLA